MPCDDVGEVDEPRLGKLGEPHECVPGSGFTLDPDDDDGEPSFPRDDMCARFVSDEWKDTSALGVGVGGILLEEEEAAAA